MLLTIIVFVATPVIIQVLTIIRALLPCQHLDTNFPSLSSLHLRYLCLWSSEIGARAAFCPGDTSVLHNIFSPFDISPRPGPSVHLHEAGAAAGQGDEDPVAAGQPLDAQPEPPGQVDCTSFIQLVPCSKFLGPWGQQSQEKFWILWMKCGSIFRVWLPVYAAETPHYIVRCVTKNPILWDFNTFLAKLRTSSFYSSLQSSTSGSECSQQQGQSSIHPLLRSKLKILKFKLKFQIQVMSICMSYFLSLRKNL